MTTDLRRRPLRLFVVAGEHSGDALGAKLMAALNAARPDGITFAGVGAEGMVHEGLASLYAMSDVAVMGPLAILKRLPRIVSRVYQTVDAALAFKPDVVVIIDAPEFTHPIAKRIRKRAPAIPIIDYVSPTVWAWRPGRAPKMKRYIDHVLGLLPFEPEAHIRLGGPACTYVGHPLIERLPWIRSLDTEPLAQRLDLMPHEKLLVVLPGSRGSEVARLMRPFGDAIGRIRASGHEVRVVIPAMAHVRSNIAAAARDWPVKPILLDGAEDKFRAFKLARAALAASGTVTLELGLAGVPMVVAYQVDVVAAQLRPFIKAQSMVLANLVIGRNVFAEFVQEDVNGDTLATAMMALLDETPSRRSQLEALAEIPARLALPSGPPSEAAAAIVLEYADRKSAS